MPGSIEIDRVSFTFGKFPILRSVRLMVESDSIVVIGGRTGGGKSTLLEICAGLKRPDRGRILWDGTDIALLSREQLLSARQRIGYMFQQNALISNYTIFDNIALPLRSIGKLTDKAISNRVHAIMEEVALFGVDSAFPESLSAGQLKSAALARALVTDPDILFLDEPLGGIALLAMNGIRSVLIAALQERKRTVIMISHEKADWDGLSMREYVLDGGKIHPAGYELISDIGSGTAHD